MAKKKAAKKRADRDPGKTRFEVRFDTEVYEELRAVAERIGVSVNQLLQGLGRWAIKNPRPGDPVRQDSGLVYAEKTTEAQQGAVWWGTTASYRPMTASERADLERDMIEAHGTDSMLEPEHYQKLEDKGHVCCHLDFTERRVVRED